ncbi:hypothetical protein RRF57_011282 [Xylaria bambusicola]|uniref:Uncharacterized protein n=1 Tax=Xylaria bambusicola TaxID=326684 RepID=A0AAN7Z3I1_9PEZI
MELIRGVPGTCSRPLVSALDTGTSRLKTPRAGVIFSLPNSDEQPLTPLQGHVRSTKAVNTGIAKSEIAVYVAELPWYVFMTEFTTYSRLIDGLGIPEIYFDYVCPLGSLPGARRAWVEDESHASLGCTAF